MALLDFPRSHRHPGTIDNDIEYIGKTFGYDTAVEPRPRGGRRSAHQTLNAYNGVGIVKLMGPTQAIAAAATLARP